MRSAVVLSFVASAAANILPRATLDPTACASSALAIAESIPTPPPAIISQFEAHPITDPCDFSIPASLSADFSTYSSEMVSWYSANDPKLKSLASACGVTTSIVPTGAIDICTAGSGSSGGSGSGSGSGSGTTANAGSAPTGSAGSAAPTTKSGNAAAPRETGMAMAALAAAGLVALL